MNGEDGNQDAVALGNGPLYSRVSQAIAGALCYGASCEGSLQERGPGLWAHPRALGDFLLRHALRDLERVLHDACHKSMAVRPVGCTLVERLHNDRLLAGLPSVEQQHNLARLQELRSLLGLSRHDICNGEQCARLRTSQVGLLGVWSSGDARQPSGLHLGLKMSVCLSGLVLSQRGGKRRIISFWEGEYAPLRSSVERNQNTESYGAACHGVLVVQQAAPHDSNTRPQA